MSELRKFEEAKHKSTKNPDGSLNYRGWVITKMDPEMTGQKGTHWNFALEGQPMEDAANTLRDAKAAIDETILEG